MTEAILILVGLIVGGAIGVYLGVLHGRAKSIVTGVYPTIAFIRGPTLRRRYRRKRGLCERCAYDLTGNMSGVCPECGMRITGGEEPA